MTKLTFWFECLFLPTDQVIDEIYRVLRFIQNNKTLPRAHEILTELRDISSMAMEHFEEKIIRTLKPTPLTSTSPRFSLPPSLSSLSPHSCKSTAIVSFVLCEILVIIISLIYAMTVIQALRCGSCFCNYRR